jgi:uncharacterized integral membrane protein
MSEKRLSWELEGGPEMPTTSEPRREGGGDVLNPPDAPAATPRQAMEIRDVEVADPELSDAANRRLTEQVQEVVGTDKVRVPTGRPHPSQGERPDNVGLLASVWSTNKFILLIITMVFIVIGAIVSVTTGSWYFMAAAVIVDALGVTLVGGLVLRMTSIRERPDPSTVAMLEEEGVRNPEEHFSNVVAEFTPEHREDGTDSDQRSVAVEDDPLQAAAEQESSMTATGGRSRPVGPGSD